MANGEVVFEAPWQGRVFGMARALAEAEVFPWDELRHRLIAELAAWERSPRGEFRYYDHFLAALEGVLAARGLLAAGALQNRYRELLARPPGHDHRHHGADHDHPGHHQHAGE
jgi:nitrile hydratase accessory protein